MLPFAAASIEVDVTEIVAVAGGLTVALAAILTVFIYSWRAKSLEADLKYEMIQRGMSADEIERVLAARMGPKDE